MIIIVKTKIFYFRELFFDICGWWRNFGSILFVLKNYRQWRNMGSILFVLKISGSFLYCWGILDLFYLYCKIPDDTVSCHLTIFDAIRTWNGMKCLEMAWNAEKCHDMPWNGVKWCEMICNDMKCFVMAWNGMKWHKMAWNTEKWNDMQWNGMKCLEITGNGMKRH